MSLKSKRQSLLRIYPFCFWCEKPLNRHTATLEHVIPKSRGGTDHRQNLILACDECNPKRGNPDVSPEQAAAIISEFKSRWPDPLPAPQIHARQPRNIKARSIKPFRGHWRGKGCAFVPVR